MDLLLTPVTVWSKAAASVGFSIYLIVCCRKTPAPDCHRASAHFCFKVVISCCSILCTICVVHRCVQTIKCGNKRKGLCGVTNILIFIWRGLKFKDGKTGITGIFSVPFLQLTASSHSDLPPSNQQLINSTKSLPYVIFLFLVTICFTKMYLIIWKKRSVATCVSSQL